MHKYITKKELVYGILLVLLIVCLINPLDLYMLDMFHMMLLGALVAVVALFAGFVVHEKITDERELIHRDSAGRVGFTIGISFITFRILMQSITGNPLDYWLPLTLLAMILGKILSRAWSRKYR
ncbi:hypothetical protein KC842_00225 [Candidatus Nomurabacteria bacterium]|nr:hypothetical protein [Candidatus Nomurabacteria bacterium]USN94749.1 MAG: hypothetical protein H6791_03275 [Candidatus Nomurabacteria bacterium]